jgi:hypothetical protein
MEEFESFSLSLHPQDSQEWKDLHSGKITASNFAAAVGNSEFDKPEEIAERIKSNKEKEFDPEAVKRMNHGKEMEPTARSWYSTHTNCLIKQVGLAVFKKNPKIGASPDGVILDGDGKWQGIIEIKCPKKMYVSYLQISKIIGEDSSGRKILAADEFEVAFIFKNHFDQMMGSLHILNLPFCDYIVYSEEHILVHRIYYDEEYSAKLFSDLENFINKYEI